MKRGYEVFKTDFSSKLKEILPKFRKGNIEKGAILELIEEYDDSPYNRYNLDEFLKNRQEEIDLIEDIVFDPELPQNDNVVIRGTSGNAGNCIKNNDYTMDFVLKILPEKDQDELFNDFVGNHSSIDESDKWFRNDLQIQKLYTLRENIIPFLKEEGNRGQFCFVISLIEQDSSNSNDFYIELKKKAEILSKHFEPIGQFKDAQIINGLFGDDTTYNLTIEHIPFPTSKMEGDGSRTFKGIIETKYRKLNETNWKTIITKTNIDAKYTEIGLKDLEPGSIYQVKFQPVMIHNGRYDREIGRGKESKIKDFSTTLSGDVDHVITTEMSTPFLPREKLTCGIIDPGIYWINGTFVGLGCLGFYPIRNKFNQARDFCAERQGHLVEIFEERQHDFLIKTAKNIKSKFGKQTVHWWIGLTYKDTLQKWIWIHSGKELKFNGFKDCDGEGPNCINSSNDALDGQIYAMMNDNVRYGMKWDDSDATNDYDYPYTICEVATELLYE
jgi:hypothetical protein